MSLAQPLKDYREARLGVLNVYLSTVLNKDPLTANWSRDYIGLTTPDSKFTGEVEIYRLESGIPKTPQKTWVIGVQAKFELILAEFNSKKMAYAYGHDIVNITYGTVSTTTTYKGGSVSAATPATVTTSPAKFKISIAGEVAQEVPDLGTLAGGANIAAAIQTAVRGLTAATPANQVYYDEFICDYNNINVGKYTLQAGGTLNGVATVVTNHTTVPADNVADDLKIGLANAGTESVFDKNIATVASTTGIVKGTRLEVTLGDGTTHETSVTATPSGLLVPIDPPFDYVPWDAQPVVDILHKKTWIAGLTRKQFSLKMVYTPTNSDEAEVVVYSGKVEATGGLSPDFGANARESQLPMTFEAIGQEKVVPTPEGDVPTQVVAELFEVYVRS